MTRTEAAALARAAKSSIAPSLNDRFWSKVDIRGTDDCRPWMAAVRNKNSGYGAFWLDGRHHPSGKIALALSGVDVPDGMCACHKCDNPSCCNPNHLFVGTRLENNDDKIAKNRDHRGESYWNAKLTQDQVSFIRSHKPAGVKRVATGIPEKLAKQFGVTKQYISELFTTGWRDA